MRRRCKTLLALLAVMAMTITVRSGISASRGYDLVHTEQQAEAVEQAVELRQQGHHGGLRLRAVDAHLMEAAAQLESSGPALDLLAEELRLAQNALGAITGEFGADDLLGVIFSSFCIGK